MKPFHTPHCLHPWKTNQQRLPLCATVSTKRNVFFHNSSIELTGSGRRVRRLNDLRGDLIQKCSVENIRQEVVIASPPMAESNLKRNDGFFCLLRKRLPRPAASLLRSKTAGLAMTFCKGFLQSNLKADRCIDLTCLFFSPSPQTSLAA